MKFTQVPIVLALLIPAIAAMPAGESVDMTERSDDMNVFEARACGAAGACKGVGGGDLCNDRCKKCSGPSGKYKKGECGGFGWQRCYCYYS
ncbi:retrovirus polyprotein [Purpureocillium lavendulum]|uniref:Retrovirus polyprotein n=1 Tax=Purpureocillium lavendulum TaxID=1247861 RepID=A0AB34FSQ2_9HYPO|nr:retrovirus polyprotein [Purpureocillium lavendulum]